MSSLGIVGGTVLTPDGRVESADILIDTDAGIIEAITEPGAAGATTSLDASDAVIIPGLVNAHTHVAMALLRGHADDKELHAWLEEDIFPVEATFTAGDVEAGAQLGMLEMIKGGTTTFCDMYFHEGAIADAAVESGLRCLLGHGILTLGKDEAGIVDDLETASSFVSAYHGSADGRIAAALMPHAVRTVDSATLTEVAAIATDLDVPIHLHCSETTGDVEAVLERDGDRPAAVASAAGVFDRDAFIAHGVHLDEDDLDVLAATGTGIAHCPTANLKLASGIAPIADALDRGVPVGIGTDGPASNNDLDMLEEVRQAALLAKAEQQDASALPAPTAIELGTVGGASLLGFDVGRIEVGAPADLAVIDLDAPKFTPRHDILSHLVYVANSGDVRHTICDGQILMRDREVLTLDETKVRETAAEAAVQAIGRVA